MNEDVIVKPGTPNPYDFANPVQKRNLFAGRKNELEDIKYYLDHARTAERAINLAVLGERASGKTSLLNIVEIEAAQKGLVPVRINLNESDVSSQMAFWYKLFDSILTKVVSHKKEDDSCCFGGEHGKTYYTYLDITSALQIPEDKTFCPFLFPIQYAKSLENEKVSRVSDQILMRDLAAIGAEAGSSIVLLLDECNVLSANRPLLEMVRNTFMNLGGFMLVFTGTPDLFPVMDEVFSPIVRGFKQIEVFPFRQIRDTQQCIAEPLKQAELDNLFPIDQIIRRGNTLLVQDSYDRLIDIHHLTGGRPYEIQLVCHFMFRRVQEGHAKSLILDLDVLEDVLAELRQRQDVDQRPIVTATRKLEQNELSMLNILAKSAGKMPFDELFFYSSLVGQNEFSRDELTEFLGEAE